MSERWMVCSACRKDIPYATLYYACSVSTCNRSALRLVFCSVECWDSHVATLRHRDAWAVEQRSPSGPGAAVAAAPRPVQSRPQMPSPAQPVRSPSPAQQPSPSPAQPVRSPSPTPPAQLPIPSAQQQSPPQSQPQSIAAPAERHIELQPADEHDILIVVSKMKKYIRDRSGMNTSDAVAERLSAHVRALCDVAIRTAAQDGRRTVLDRDVPSARR